MDKSKVNEGKSNENKPNTDRTKGGDQIFTENQLLESTRNEATSKFLA